MAVLNQQAITTQVMTIDEVAALLRVHRSTLYRLLKAGKLPSFRVGTDHRFTREAIEEWCHAQEYSATTPKPRRHS